MSKSIYEEALKESKDFGSMVGLRLDKVNKALEQAQKQEQEHIEYSKKVQEQFSNDTKRIGGLESKLIRQNKLLGLYKELLELNKKHTTFKVKRQLDIEKLIKELERE